MGKIAAAAAIGGGLAVALAVVVVVSLVRPKQRTLVELPKAQDVEAARQEARRTAREVAAAASTTSRQAPATPTPATPTPTPTPTSTSNGKTAEIPITVKSKAAGETRPSTAAPPAPEPKRPAAKAGAPAPAPRPAARAAPGKKPSRARVTRVKHRRASKHSSKRASKRSRAASRRRSGGSGKLASEVDALLAAGSRRRNRPAATADADAILSAGTKPRRKAAGSPSSSSDNVDADAILAAGTKPRRKSSSGADGAKSINQVQIRAAMRRIMPKVRACYEKYGEAGLVRVKVTVRPTGKADGTVVGKFAGTPTGFCVLGGVYKAVFPRFTGKPITFTYPFKLQ
jgi:hypothetical protein